MEEVSPEERALLSGPTHQLDGCSTYAEAVEAVREVAQRGPTTSWVWDLLAVLERHEGGEG